MYSPAYRGRDEALARMNIPVVSLDECDYNQDSRSLALPSDNIGMPRTLIVRSHRTGKEVRFVVVGPEDKLFDPDQWDGEQQIYRPVEDTPRVSYLVIFNRC